MLHNSVGLRYRNNHSHDSLTKLFCNYKGFLILLGACLYMSFIIHFYVSDNFIYTDNSQEYYVLAFKKCSSNYKWSMHGLWPQQNIEPENKHYLQLQYPQYCRNITFDINKVSSLINLLNKNWYSCYGNNPSFWKHEWEKHGTCTNFDTFHYFEKAISLFNKYVINCNNSQLKTTYSVQNTDQDSCELKLDKYFNLIN